jgi:hypothetical protein
VAEDRLENQLHQHIIFIGKCVSAMRRFLYKKYTWSSQPLSECFQFIYLNRINFTPDRIVAMKTKTIRTLAICGIGIFTLLLANLLADTSHVRAQESLHWSQAERIPEIADDTEPPILVADQNRTVHAFAHQQVGEDEPQEAIIYSQWTVKDGWTSFNDILLSPLKNSAQVAAAMLDQRGIIHLLFLGGDNTEAEFYYSNAPAAEAGQTLAWSHPTVVGEGAYTPVSGVLTGDDQGNLVVVYRGRQDGLGLYVTYSADFGATWTPVAPLFLTYSDILSPLNVRGYRDQVGLLHLVWNVITEGGQGREIYYARSQMGTREWSEPIQLASIESGYGVLLPTLVEHQDRLWVVFYETPKIVMRYSSNKGETWSGPLIPFEHIGVNGTMSLVVDSDNALHLLWAQRMPVTGGVPIHGAWHSVWQEGNQWSRPQAIVSGPAINDSLGFTSFDPYGIQAVISQGNVLLATWRTDPGDVNRPNGVRYSFAMLHSPELPVVPLSTPPPLNTSIPPSLPVPSEISPTSMPDLTKNEDAALVLQKQASGSGSPAAPLMIGLTSAAILVTTTIVAHRSRRRTSS